MKRDPIDGLAVDARGLADTRMLGRVDRFTRDLGVAPAHVVALLQGVRTALADAASQGDHFDSLVVERRQGTVEVRLLGGHGADTLLLHV